MSEISISLGLRSINIKSFLRFIAVMDLNTYEGSFVFFYDILTELAKSKILQTIVEVYLILN